MPVQIIDYILDKSILVEFENTDNVHQIVTMCQKCSKKHLLIFNGTK